MFHVGEILEILNAHVEAGRIGAFGGSNWSVERLQEANDYAEKNGLVGFSFSSPNLSLAKAQEPYWAGCVSVDDPMLAWHEKIICHYFHGHHRLADFSQDVSLRKIALTKI